MIGCDSPTLPPAILRSAFTALRQEAEVVLGPAADGGYDLVPADLDRLRADLGPPGPGAGKTAAFIDDLLREGRLPRRTPRAPV